MKNLCFVLLCLFSFLSTSAQMMKNGQTLYGNEWINYSKNYIKVEVDRDGFYKITHADLLANGFTQQQLNGSSFKMHSNGEEVALYVTKTTNWAANDYLAFYGEKNDGELDSYLFDDAETEQLNPEASMYSNNRSYYLTVEPTLTNLRYSVKPNNVDGTTLSKRTFYMESLKQVFSDDVWDPGAPTDRDLQFSHFIGMDGFASRMKNDHSIELEVKNYYSAGPDPKINLRIGSNNSTHFVQLEFNNNPILNDNFQGSKVRQYEIDFDKANIRQSINSARLRGLSTADNVSIAYLELLYPRTYDAANSGVYNFFSGNNRLDEHVEIPNFGAGFVNFVFDVDNHNMVVPKVTGRTASVVIPGGSIENARIVLTNFNEIKKPNTIEQVSFKNIENLNPEYLIITSEKLNQTEQGRNAIVDYDEFRKSQLGGSYKTAIINVEDIYNQFGYGVNNYSYAIKNFGAYVNDKWADFEMVFIIGKGLSFASNFKTNTIAKSYVPTYGRPGSDNLFFALDSKAYPYVGVGRLAAQSQEDILIYLEKAKTNARLSDVDNLSIQERLWLKNVMHLSGGDPKIQQEIFDTLSIMETILENNQYAAAVTTYRKNSSDPVTTALTEEILGTINSGISLLTFFGHSSAGTFDFSVEDPSEYMNFGKHPVVLSMGCHSGDIHENINSLSEKFLLTEDLGAIAFLASSGNAYPEPLSAIGMAFYEEIGSNYYGLPISLAIKTVSEKLYKKTEAQYENSAKLLSLNDSYANVISLLEQNTLHGDPAVGFFYANGPDYVVDLGSIGTMDVVGTSDENIELCFDLLNLGAGLDADSLNNFIVHKYSTNSVDTIYFKSVATKNKSKVCIDIPNPGKEALGKNSINIVLDYDNKVEEQPAPTGELNNDLNTAWSITEGFCFYIFDNSAQPIYPTEFSIVGKQGITLKASAPNALAEKDYYQIEVDTTETFNSPFLRSVEVYSHPSLIEWKTNITFREEVVYYWRVKPKNNPQAIWNNSSFVFLKDVDGGWNQSHFYQWTKDETKTAFIDSTTRDFTYVESVNDVRISNGVYPETRIVISHQDNINKFIQFGDEIISGVYMATFDGNTGLPKYAEARFGGEFGSHFGGSRGWVGDEYFCFPFKTTTPDQRKNVINFIEDEVPDGDYVVFFTIQRTDFSGADYYPERWANDAAQGGKDLMTTLEKYGAKNVRTLADFAVPYVFVFKKNDLSYTPVERVANNLSEELEVDLKINSKWFEGEITSTTIGPASAWDKLIWNIDEIDLQEDTYKLDVIGINRAGQEVLLYENVDEFDFDLSQISTATYPELKLNLYTQDNISRSSAQMEHWRVLYTELPEAVLNTGMKFAFESDTILGGDNFKFSTVATNITNADMDSLDVEYTITDRNNISHVTKQRLAPLKAFENIDIDFETSSGIYLGVNEFKVEINPRKIQEEKFYFNNLGLRSFAVIGDIGNPLLDVTFDGVRILDEDIVSPNPTITVMLKDDNTFNPITDISSFDLALQKLPDNQSLPVALDSENITFFPADSTNDFCARIEYTPEFESGEYILYVQGRDASGNLSGDQAYQVKFQVILESSVSKVLNYPNPFSTSTEFIFTLTGREVPEEFTIQIYSMSGKVVKEITKDELGSLRLGLNRTKYKWNGTDDYGNKLANGVYVYRVITSKVDGEELSEYTNNGKLANLNSYFKKGFGKLVIMR